MPRPNPRRTNQCTLKPEEPLKLTAGDDAISATTDVLLEGGNIDAKATDKGVNAGVYLIGTGSKVTIDAEDDAIHSDGGLRLSSGEFQLAAGDDGVHAEVASVLDGAKLTVSKSAEALEGGLITIAAGDITLTSADDGINASGSTTAEAGREAIAAAESASETNAASEKNPQDVNANHPKPPAMPADGQMPQPPAGGMGESTGEQLNITGGTVTINAGGDGLDSNGDATISGGTVTVWGPTNNGNGALDVAGELKVTGGTLLAVGSSGMAMTPTSTDGLGFFSANVTGSKGDEVTIKDSAGKTLKTFAATKDFGNVVYSAAEVNNGETYTVSVGRTVAEATAGEVSQGMGGGPMGGSPVGGGPMGGQRP